MTPTSIRRACWRGLTVLLVAPLLLVALPAQAQKRPLTHQDYDSWKSVRGTTYSKDGKWAAWSVEPQWGDGVLVVRQVDGDVEYRHERGTNAAFSPDGRFVVFRIDESEVEKRAKKIEELREKGKLEKKEEEGEQSEAERRRAMMRRFGRGRGGRSRGGSGSGDLGILDLSTGEVEVIERVKGFRLPKEGGYVVYHLDEPEEEEEEEKGKKEGEVEEKKEGGVEEKKEGEKPAEAKKEGGKPAEAKKEGEGEAKKETEAAPGRRAGGRRGGAGRREGGRRGGGRPREGQEGEEEDEDPAAKKRKDGTELVVRNLAEGNETRIASVRGYGILGDGDWIWFHTQTKKVVPEVQMGLFAVKPADGTKVQLVKGAGNYTGFTVDDAKELVAFTSDVDDFAAEKPVSSIYLWSMEASPARKVIGPDTAGLPEGKVPASGGLSFSTDSSVMTFNVQDAPEEDLPEILPEEKVVLDLWHWQDGILQPMQARQAGRERRKTVPCAFHVEDGSVVVLGDENIDSARLITPDGGLALATDGTPYEKLISWDGRYRDAYLINTVDGSRQKVLEKVRGSVSASPLGRYLTWFADDHWHCMDTATLQIRNLTVDIGVPFANELEDRPQPASGYGIAGWSAHDDEVLINDRYDIWKIDPDTGHALCVTDGMGRARKITFRYVSIELEDEEQTEEGFDPFAPDASTDPVPERIMVSATDTETMATGYYMESTIDVQKPRKLVMLDKRFGGLNKVEDADRFFFTLQTFSEYPDLWTSDMEFGGMKKLSNANPQQENIRWGKAELVRWTSLNGSLLKGILIKPEGFDPKKKYPMMVYFYERRSQDLHRYVAPSPGTSPNAAYYVSNGYVWFTPDIEYRVGYPGPSCLACVVPGVQHLIDQGFVDRNRIGAAGHSWGGYQTAFLVTRTNIFAAVESGAPVSNMFSAYGGIRWSSGMVRQFQYEKTQSRIGGSIWEYPMRYWENSPIFFADKVNTPVLILHNDEDGAVPWYQGIEYFTALRRLGKEAYLFNYVGAGHGLRKRQNQKDWTRRMQEYFDHHLKGEPAPKWMVEGVPYIEREEEKLPYAPSFLEITAPEPEATEASTSTSENGSTSGGGN